MEELNTSPGGETPSSTGGANDAAVETQPTSTTTETPVQSASEPSTTEEFSAGWSYGEEEPQSTEPTEDEITELTKDPSLDQTKVPGLVEKLRQAWAVGKTQKAELASLREQIAKLEQYGGLEGAGQMAGLASGLIRDPQKGVGQFMSTLAKESLPAYQGIADTLVQYEHEYLVQALRAAGKLPEIQQQTAGQQLTAEDWGRIPKELHDIAKQIPVNELINWLDNGNDQTLQMMLETRKELSELKGAQRQQAETAYRQAYQQAQAQGQESVQNLSNQFEQAHYKELAKWQPFGPQANEQNQQLYRSILEGAHRTLMGEKQWQDLYQDTVNKLANAPMRRLSNDHMAADADERDARGAAARYNARLGQVMKGMIQSLDSVFRDARAYRETQREQIPNRTEISGQSTQTGKNGAPPTLLPNGKTNPAYLDYVISSLPQNAAR